MLSHLSVCVPTCFTFAVLAAVFLNQSDPDVPMAYSASGTDRPHLSDLCLRMEAMEASGSDTHESPADPLEPLQNAVDSTRQRLTALEDEIRSIKRLIKGLNRQMMADIEKRDADRASLKTLIGTVHNAFCLFMMENTSP